MKNYEQRKTYVDYNNEEISKIHFVFMADVSGSMKETYNKNELQGKSGKIYDLFEDFTKK